MRVQRWLLWSYGILLRLYPPEFRQRFAPEMLELAGAADVSEWPLIFSDTSVAIVRCWVEGSPSTATLAEPNAYASLGGSPVRSFGLGFVLSAVVILSLAYVGYRWPPACPSTRTLSMQVVAPPQSPTHTAVAPQNVSGRNTHP